MAEKADERAAERAAEERAQKALKAAEDAALLPGFDVFVECTAGPFRGKRIQMPNGMADQAESEGWGYRLLGNPLEAPIPDASGTPQETFDVGEKAYEAYDELVAIGEGAPPEQRGSKRGRGRPKKQAEAEEREPERETRQMEADEENRGRYETRDVKTRK
jgi:hypothetical protein